jgi:tetratricopeptide (TPR) repeat protein
MSRARKTFALFILMSLLSGVEAFAKEYYEFYEEGLAAVRNKQWSVVIEKMNAAINIEPNENKRARSYGANFFAYHPYYYRGIAYFNLNQYQLAIDDLQKALGTGKENLGTPESWVLRAEQRMMREPPPVAPPTTQTVAVTQPPTQTVPVTPPPTQTTVATDPALAGARQRAEGLIAQAQQKQSAATKSRASSLAAGDFTTASQTFSQAQQRRASARTSGDWNEVGNLADQASRQFDLAISNAKLASAGQPATTTTQASPVVVAGDNVAIRASLRSALSLYFEGDFEASSKLLEGLSGQQASNPMILAFLGAARYNSYVLSGGKQEEKKALATDAFRRAKQIKPGLELSAKYFSPRVRNFYESVN